MAADEQARAGSDPWSRALGRWCMAVLRVDHLGTQAVRFAISGTVVSIVYIAITTFLAEALGLRFLIAMTVGWCASVSIHFALHRTFVWARKRRFALSIGRQVPRYLLLSVTQFGLTAASTAVMPSALGLPAEVVYLATGVMLTGLNFALFRNGIFHARASDAGAG